MAVTVEVPLGHKFCKGCGGVFKLDMFARRHDKPNATHNSRCNTCKNEQRRINRAKAPPKVHEPLWQRPSEERECDTAFMGWREVAGAAFQGARL